MYLFRFGLLGEFRIKKRESHRIDRARVSEMEINAFVPVPVGTGVYPIKFNLRHANFV